MTLAEQVRRAGWHYLSYDVAVGAGLTLSQLTGFLFNRTTLTDLQLRRLARRMGIEEKKS